MKFLVVGLGSMGKRRVRNLQALGFKDIVGFDTRSDRTTEAQEKYDIITYNDLETALKEFSPTAFIISTPPDLHMHYAFIAYRNNISCFIEASVVDAKKILELDNLVKDTSILMAPSCTMRFYPGPKKVKELVTTGKIGKILNINYHTGQFLPDWHPWEKIEDFYVSKRETGGAREIVPFELTWLNDIFGNATPLACVKSKQTDMNADIDDIYHCLMRYDDQNILANLCVEVISRPVATREMRILGSEGEIVFSADSNSVRYINTTMSEWEEFRFDTGTVESNYINPEEPYIEEVRAFTSALKNSDKSLYPNTLQDDYAILVTLSKLEQLSI